MFWRMVGGALFRQKGKMLMIAFTIALGSGLSTAMLNTMLGVGDKVNQELKTYGANITVVHKEASLLGDIYGLQEEKSETAKFLKEDELPKIKTIFWAYNIVDYAPFFSVFVNIDTQSRPIKVIGTWFNYEMKLPTGQTVSTGIRRMRTWWDVNGSWLEDSDDSSCMIGSRLAGRNNLKVGDTLSLKTAETEMQYRIAAIFNAGSEEDDNVYVSLHAAQKLAGKKNIVEHIEVSALTTPDNDLARKAARNPLSLTIKEKEIWYCTAYVSSICYQIQEVMTDAVAKPLRQVAESEGAILNKTTLLMLLITILSLIASALGISNLVTASVMERRAEIGLQKAIGASNAAVSILILTEVMIIGIFGGIIGYFGGLGLTQIIGHTVFGSAIALAPMVIPIVVIIIFLITLIGSFPAVRYLLKLNPTEVLHGR
ncbi:MAG: ABC transporter permease [Treponema phagedenis]|uniref:ABC transporter permease n=1 Tax=Treponema phagedenis TaxID=162 RepID=UPI0011E75538|nr:ABC transporter permease [Treponema phagedenis]QEJ94879.1 ABC transporter permease [Treponema phagedenis]